MVDYNKYINEFIIDINECDNTGVSLQKYRQSISMDINTENPKLQSKQEANSYYIFKKRLSQYVKTKFNTTLIIKNKNTRGSPCKYESKVDVAKFKHWPSGPSSPELESVTESSPVSTSSSPLSDSYSMSPISILSASMDTPSSISGNNLFEFLTLESIFPSIQQQMFPQIQQQSMFFPQIQKTQLMEFPSTQSMFFSNPKHTIDGVSNIIITISI